tara:strand:+ start:160 stop:429 length:270 start_codon:yes stop_codon:yes gene_type:complete
MTTIFYDFHEFAKSGEYKQCKREKGHYPCSKIILDTWANKFTQSELLRTSQQIQLGTWTIRPRMDYSTRGFRENEKLNYHCCVIKRKKI